jgi:hypothetical protein
VNGSTDSADAPFAFYDFDETTGTTAHGSQGDHHETIVGAAHVPGLIGDALAFNGSSDYVSLPDSSDWGTRHHCYGAGKPSSYSPS